MYGAEKVQPVIEECGLGVVKRGGQGTGIFPLDICADFADCRKSGLQGI